MYEVVVRFKGARAIKVLRTLGKCLGFTIVYPKEGNAEEKEVFHINGVPIERGDPKINIEDLTTIFTEEDIDARTLRESTWHHKE